MGFNKKPSDQSSRSIAITALRLEPLDASGLEAIGFEINPLAILTAISTE
jgi:hypothetical protein